MVKLKWQSFFVEKERRIHMTMQIMFYGEKDGIQTYRLCGTKERIYAEIKYARKQGFRFHDTPIILPVFRGQWTTILKLIPPVLNSVE
jgi:hypothetical protein